MVWCGTPIITGLFLGHCWWVYYIHRRTDRIHLVSAKTAWGKIFHPNQSEVRRLKFLGVNCQVVQHSILSCNSASFLQRGFYTGRGVEATQPNWLLKICMCLLLKCPPSLQPHNLVSVWTKSLIKTNGTMKYSSINLFNKWIMMELNLSGFWAEIHLKE